MSKGKRIIQREIDKLTMQRGEISGVYLAGDNGPDAAANRIKAELLDAVINALLWVLRDGDEPLQRERRK
jgi:hypothetical protein